ncbi:MAG: phosphate signaling complex protein PhoU [Thermotogota bacterium]
MAEKTTRGAYVDDLHALEREVLVLGERVAVSIREGLRVLQARDQVAARALIAGDAAINKKRYEIEEHCLRLLATQQPMAGDLRRVTAALHVASDLERMGDQAEGIGKIVLLLGTAPLIKPLIDIPKLADVVLEMLADGMDAYSRWDGPRAREIAGRDDEADRLHDLIDHDLFHLMAGDPSKITQATYLMWVSHNLERIADLVTNVCEQIVFVSSGSIEELNVYRASDDKPIQ